MDALTRKEEEILRQLYQLEKAFVKDIIAALPGKKPAYTTVSTVIRKLEEKGYVDHEQFGTTYRYFPTRPIEELQAKDVGKVLREYFSGSAKELVSHFAKNKHLTRADLEEVMRMIDEQNQ
ncbi:BlaI/MecI/CopY family transcriptional regulator [Lewinella sp. 4G2]|uniref:BlaI/MecI/CopY family transcriptional regulator n=1 Tax=Lewinella sp. 4G2 TaxID=1803372 RepID=UPI0007B48E51|nr:BlaI/MecI/CopY family transcriptional regulator [Lewinella sp. 4G2]OAV46005.1 transcriptional regulator [Lewinella sp. 4G2]